MTVRKCEINEKNLATVEFSFDGASVEEKKAAAYKKNAAKFNIPGFRRGKAPRSLIEKMYGKGVFLEDAVNALLGESYDEIIGAAGKTAVSSPSFDIVSEGDDEYVFKAEFYVKPDIQIEGYRGISVEVVKTPVEDSEVDAEIEAARKRNSRELEINDRAAESGDTAVIDYEGFCDGVAFEGGKGEDHHLKLGSGTFIPGFEDQIIGKNTGDSFDVNVTFPEEYHAKELAGKPAVFKTVLKKILFEELPELNDDFAVEVSEFNTFEEYRADVKAKIEKRHDDNADRELSDKLDEALAGLVKEEIPAAMIDNEVEGMVRDTESRMQMNGIDLKTYLNYFQMTLDGYKESLRPNAEKAVRSRLALEKIAELENIEISDEAVEDEYKKVAESYNVSIDYAKENLPAEDVKETLKIRRAMDIVKESAVVTYLDKYPEPEAPAAEEKPKKPRKKKTTTPPAEE